MYCFFHTICGFHYPIVPSQPLYQHLYPCFFIISSFEYVKIFIVFIYTLGESAVSYRDSHNGLGRVWGAG